MEEDSKKITLKEKLECAIPGLGLYTLDKLEKKLGKRLVPYKMLNIIFYGFLYVSLLGTHIFIIKPYRAKLNQEKLERERITNICKELDYKYPEKVNKIESDFLNNDRIRDYIFHLKNGSKLEYLSKLEYKVKEYKVK